VATITPETTYDAMCAAWHAGDRVAAQCHARKLQAHLDAGGPRIDRVAAPYYVRTVLAADPAGRNFLASPITKGK
jgi:hypothetical protein